MITMKLDKFKSTFFDPKKVLRAVDKARRESLSKAGAFIRTAARSSIRKRKRASAPGSPPSSHTGILKRFIFFGYDSSADSVVVGPAKTNQLFFNGAGKPVTGTVPEALEYGGTIRVFEVFKNGKWRRANLRSRRRLAGLKTRLRKVPIRPRPFMGPAMKQELPKFPSLWRNSVRANAA